MVLLLRRYQRLHSADFYYKLRSSHPRSAHTRAARFIYLNRTCWNGLYRVNRAGRFNVPIGTRKTVLFPADDFCAISAALEQASLIASDFEQVISAAQPGDLIFADPPYVTSRSHSGFRRYHEKPFTRDDQVRLRDCIRQAKGRGVHVLSTNADNPSIRCLYEPHFHIRIAARDSAIAANAARRGLATEMVIRSW